ncbi:hypothetical protein GCM10010532_096710 [Dactylosporangium siamense]|uniref:Winged helix-turn helix domain-containing protein n=1 Tax=Dactylosporangium siamense TaxID=685454 RepID=A0A919PTL7_9ACTN|nr:winged helix-turn-helix domain-containing protein [Dactylosporangium siamense]GIG49964.1 hypothetical protein Dsi01nite_080050 [Dactylosporangium siamense]
MAADAAGAGALRPYAGRNADDTRLSELVGEPTIKSPEFRTWFRTRCSLRGTAYLLHRMGFSVQAPKHRPVERDEDAVVIAPAARVRSSTERRGVRSSTPSG